MMMMLLLLLLLLYIDDVDDDTYRLLDATTFCNNHHQPYHIPVEILVVVVSTPLSSIPLFVWKSNLNVCLFLLLEHNRFISFHRYNTTTQNGHNSIYHTQTHAHTQIQTLYICNIQSYTHESIQFSQSQKQSYFTIHQQNTTEQHTEQQSTSSFSSLNIKPTFHSLSRRHHVKYATTHTTQQKYVYTLLSYIC